MKNLIEYKTLLWDFDGVIMDSNEIREQGFKEVLKSYPNEQVDKLVAFHRINGGLSRYVKFRYFFETIRKEGVLSPEKLNEFTEKFGLIMKTKLQSESLLIADSVNFIKKYSQKIDMHIVSGSDQLELRSICEGLHLSKYFKSINGSPTHKNDLVKAVIEKEQLERESVCLIGDSINDLDAAEINKINFVGYNNPALIQNDYIVSFNDQYL